MGIIDYTKKPWKLKSTAGVPRCTHQKGCVIKIDGPGTAPDDVTVRCLVNHDDLYENGTYDPETDTISGETYQLRREEGPPHLLFCTDTRRDENGVVTGSWTADDSGTFGGDE